MRGSLESKSLNLDHRHLAFFFLAAVGVCAVFFALGYVVGRAHSATTPAKEPWAEKSVEDSSPVAQSSPAAESTAKEGLRPVGGDAKPAGKEVGEEVATAAGSEPPPDLDFYKAVKESKVDENFHPDTAKEKTPSKASAKSDASKSAKNISKAQPAKQASDPVISLQVAALKGTAEAEKLAKTLRSKGYHVFVIHPDKNQPDQLIRVQVGPYNSDSEAAKIKKKLESEGYKSIVKHP
ncbi:MAG: SPOR domain-containing protein [Terriglobia bacterium]